MKKDKSLEELSFDEVLEQLSLTTNQGRKYSIYKLFIRLSELNLNNKLQEEVLSRHFKKIIEKLGNKKSIKLLNSISNKTLREKTITESYDIILVKFSNEEALELLNSISDNNLKERIIFNFFDIIITRFDKEKALELLNSISDDNLKEKIISKFFSVILEKFYNDESLQLLNSISNKSLKEKTITDSFSMIVRKFNNIQSLKFLNSIINKNLREKAIYNSFNKIIEEFETNQTFEILNLISDIDLREKTISKAFSAIISQLEKNQAFKFLNLISNINLREKTIYKNFPIIITHFENNQTLEFLNFISNNNLKEKAISKAFPTIILHFDNNQILELLNSISNNSLKEEALFKSFYKAEKFNEAQTFKFFNLILNTDLKEKLVINKIIKELSCNKLKNNITIKYFNIIFQIDIEKGFELLDLISSKELKEKIFHNSKNYLFLSNNQYINIRNINLYIKFSLDKNIVPDIEIVEKIINKELKEKTIKTFFNFFIEINREKAIKLLSKIEDKEFQKQSSQLNINILIQKLNSIQKNINTKNQNSAIIKAYKTIQKENSNSIDLNKLTIERLSFLIIYEEKEENFNKLINIFIQKTKQENKNFSELAFNIIKNSKIQNKNLYLLERLINDKKTKQKLKKFKEQKNIQKEIYKILDIVINSKRKDKDRYFVQLFKEKYNINNIHTVIPQIAKKDFKLAKRLINRIKDKKQKEKTQEEIFLTLQENLEQIMFFYERIDNFYIKEKLSKKALSFHLPTFTNSFFYKSLSALDSKNIMKTLDELATIAPKEVLKYYKEINDRDEEKFHKIINKIKILQQKVENAKEDDDKEWELIENEEKEIKNYIKSNTNIYNIFLEKYKIKSFRRFSLLDIETEF